MSSPALLMVLQQFNLEPLTSAVLQGSDVRFRATVDGLWRVMTWNVRGLLVLTVLIDSNITSSPGQFSATFCSSGDTSCVDFIIHNVTRGESGPVICTVQGDYGSKTAQLTVQESGTVSIVGGNVTVAQDQDVEFQCITTAWFPAPTITWTRNGQSVDSSLYNTNNTVEGDFFNSTSVLQFQAVTSDAKLECLATVQALTNPQTSSVFLVVVPRAPDWTVLIAVVLSFAGCALLVLLIIGIVFCYKRRKEKQPSYQEEMSRRVTQSQTQGQVNTVYVPERRASVTPTQLTDNDFCQADISNIVVMPHVRNHQAGNGDNSDCNTVDQSVVRKHRHVTIV
ncbi:immunoglobulin superfamily member 5 [Anabas testudineus]|uniref:immunoglobulin superfamily member 5 n=1 Tax=Anabas testudineus TaxID=64144 RepID=UPI000E45B006|nr:immunoglobulin superfamily member 5 [Anabas testudineus]